MCLWCAFDVPLMCLWCAFDVPLMCLWYAFDVLLMCLWCAFDVLLICFWCWHIMMRMRNQKSMTIGGKKPVSSFFRFLLGAAIFWMSDPSRTDAVRLPLKWQRRIVGKALVNGGFMIFHDVPLTLLSFHNTCFKQKIYAIPSIPHILPSVFTCFPVFSHHQNSPWTSHPLPPAGSGSRIFPEDFEDCGTSPGLKLGAACGAYIYIYIYR